MKKTNSIRNASLVIVIFLGMAIASTPPPAPSATVYNGLFSYPAEKNEVVKNAAKLKFLKDNSNPTIVLRVPHATRQVLEEDKNLQTNKNNNEFNSISNFNVYNIIEKELLKGGFTVRDRALFDKVLGDKSVNDYSKIKELTETDLILELSDIQYVRHPLNSFNYTKKGKKGALDTETFFAKNQMFLYGLRLEFRLIKVKDNDFIGSFTYNYSPCSNQCMYNVNCLNGNCGEPYIMEGNITTSGIKLISDDDIIRFVTTSSQSLVKEIMQ